MMKVLLLGGTGVIGTALINVLSADSNMQVYVTSRRHIPSNDRVKYIEGNAKDIKFIKKILSDDYDIVIDFMLYSVEEFNQRIDILLSLSKHYVFLSSSRVYSSSTMPLTENSSRLNDISDDADFLKCGEYSLTKAKEEDILNNSGWDNWTIIRPYKTYGADRFQLGVFEKEQWIYRAINGKTIVLQDEISKRLTSLTDSIDTANVIKKVIEMDVKNRKIIQIASPQSYSWRKIFELYSSIFEKETGKALSIKLIEENDVIEKMFNNKYRIKYDGMLDRVFSDQTIQSMYEEGFHWTSVEDGINRYLTKFIFLNKKKHYIPDYMVEGYFDRLTNEKESLYQIPGIKNVIKYYFFRYCPIEPYFMIKMILKRDAKH